MTISPFFLQLRSAYQAEMDDLTFDSDGRDVLRQRLVDKRKGLDFLLQMIDTCPEMVAVIFHQGFRFKRPAVMEHLLCQEGDELPEWDTLLDAVQLAPWAEETAEVILQQPMGAWFMTVAAGLEYMHSRPEGAKSAKNADDNEDADEDDNEKSERDADGDRDEDGDDERSLDEAGADWMAEQGFDRKD